MLAAPPFARNPKLPPTPTPSFRIPPLVLPPALAPFQVYDGLGDGVLTNALKGFNCCLFAYGQTGAGKSYSFVGYGTNRGIVPQVCDSIFTRKVDIEASGNTKLQVRRSVWSCGHLRFALAFGCSRMLRCPLF